MGRNSVSGLVWIAVVVGWALALLGFPQWQRPRGGVSLTDCVVCDGLGCEHCPAVDPKDSTAPGRGLGETSSGRGQKERV